MREISQDDCDQQARQFNSLEAVPGKRPIGLQNYDKAGSCKSIAASLCTWPSGGTFGRFRLEAEPGYDYDFHRAPQKQYIILVDGGVQIETSRVIYACLQPATFYW